MEFWGRAVAAWSVGRTVVGAQHLGQGIGEILWRALPSRRAWASQAVAHHLGYDTKAAQKIAWASFVHTGMAVAEILATRTAGPRFLEEHVTIEEPQLVTQFYASSRPLVVVSGHVGAWELLVALIALLPQRPSCRVVVRLPKSPWARGFLLHARNFAQIQSVGHRDASSGVLQILRQGGVAAFLVDHHCHRREAVRLPFLGEEASVNRGPAVLAVRSQAEVWPLFLLRQGLGRFRLVVSPPLDTQRLSGSPGERVQTVCQFYTAAVEETVRRWPEQWMWLHRRWKS